MAKINVNLDALKPKREWKRHKVQPGHNIFRILPPFGPTANGYPYRKWMITWGLLDPESGRMRPFASSLTSEKKCPIFEYVDLLAKKAEAIKSDMKAKGASDADVKERLQDINKVLSNLRPKTVYAYNAINKAGEVGILEVKATAQKKLKDLMMQYIQDYAQDPTSLNSDTDDSGVWFDITRTGEGFNTEYDAVKVQLKTKDPATNKTMFVDDQSPLPDNVVQNYESMAYDLGAIYQTKTYDELKAILLANLRNIVSEVPEAAVPGFDDFGDVVVNTAPTGNSGGSRQGSDDTVRQEPAKGTKKVNLNLGAADEDDLDSEPAPRSNGKAAKPAAAATIDDDVFALADSILN